MKRPPYHGHYIGRRSPTHWVISRRVEDRGGGQYICGIAESLDGAKDLIDWRVANHVTSYFHAGACWSRQ